MTINNLLEQMADEFCRWPLPSNVDNLIGSTGKDVLIREDALAMFTEIVGPKIEALEAELHALDELLARRPALGDCKTRYEMVSLALSTAEKANKVYRNMKEAKSQQTSRIKPKCPLCGSSEVDRLHHIGDFYAPECFYWNCCKCNCEWGHA